VNTGYFLCRRDNTIFVTGNSGMDKINMQNITRGSDLRKAFKAPEGQVLVTADLRNIELRVGFWLAGDWANLQLIADGVDLYKTFASLAFVVPYDKVTKDQRFIGKTSQLSLSFSVGAATLQNAIRAGIGLDMGIIEAKRVVNLYRASHPCITSMWTKCGVAIKAMVEDRYMSLGTDDLIKVEGRKGIKLPSGLYLKYPELQLSVDAQTGKREYKYKMRGGWDRLYPGKLWNNIVQAVARCVMAEAMPRIARVYLIVLSVHDSLYVLALEAEAQAAQDFLIEEMCRPPVWMPDIPLDAEGHYGKTLWDC
jgi:DNA polymerase